MSVQNRRKALLGFGALAAVLIVAVIVTWPPPYFDKDEATGAIGAVQKHREQQITPQDVVLGDETTRREQKVVFANYLDDAAKLQSISADLASQAAVRSSLSNADHQLENMAADIQNRFAENLNAALAAMNQLLARDSVGLSAAQLESINAEIAELSAKTSRRINNEEMVALSAQLANVSKKLDAASRYGNRAAMEAHTLKNAEEQLGKAVASLQAVSWRSNKALVDAASQIENASKALEAKSADVAYSNFVDYLGALALEAKKLAAVRSNLDAISRLANEEQMASQLKGVSAALANEAYELEAQALENIQKRLVGQSALSAQIRNIDQMVAAANRSVGQHASSLENQSLSAFNKAIGNFSQNLENRSQEFQARAVDNIRSELAVIGAHLEARKKLQAMQLDASSPLAVRLADNRSIDSHIANLSRSLESQSALGAALQNRAELAAQARELRNRAEASN